MKYLAMLIPLLAMGCNSGTADVSGTVKFGSRPVVYGTVVIIASDGTALNAPIGKDGTFRISGVKKGPAKIAVNSPRPPGMKAVEVKSKAKDDEGLDGRRPADEGAAVDPFVKENWIELPARYSDPGTSELTADIGSGEELVLDLKP